MNGLVIFLFVLGMAGSGCELRAEGPAVSPTPLAVIPINATAVAPVASGESPAELSYQLKELQAVSLSTYPGGAAGLLRHYLHFHNSDGNHYLVYEEDSGVPAMKEVAALQQAMAGGGVSCSMELGCRKKAFCTSKCANMYYQLSNSASASGDSDRCHLISHTCIQSGSREPAATK